MSLGSFQPNGEVVASGPLPGILQSSYRAELFDIWRALLLGRTCEARVFLWTDCDSVVKRLRRLLGGHKPRLNSAHADLWLEIFHCLQDYRVNQVVVTKVAAHLSLDAVGSALEEWCVLHNAYSDRAAQLAQWKRSPEFWRF